MRGAFPGHQVSRGGGAWRASGCTTTSRASPPPGAVRVRWRPAVRAGRAGRAAPRAKPSPSRSTRATQMPRSRRTSPTRSSGADDEIKPAQGEGLFAVVRRRRRRRAAAAPPPRRRLRAARLTRAPRVRDSARGSPSSEAQSLAFCTVPEVGATHPACADGRRSPSHDGARPRGRRRRTSRRPSSSDINSWFAVASARVASMKPPVLHASRSPGTRRSPMSPGNTTRSAIGSSDRAARPRSRRRSTGSRRRPVNVSAAARSFRARARRRGDDRGGRARRPGRRCSSDDRGVRRLLGDRGPPRRVRVQVRQARQQHRGAQRGACRQDGAGRSTRAVFDHLAPAAVAALLSTIRSTRAASCSTRPTRTRTRCRYDTRDKTSTTMGGDRTQDEMCLFFFAVEAHELAGHQGGAEH